MKFYSSRVRLEYLDDKILYTCNRLHPNLMDQESGKKKELEVSTLDYTMIIIIMKIHHDYANYANCANYDNYDNCDNYDNYYHCHNLNNNCDNYHNLLSFFKRENRLE